MLGKNFLLSYGAELPMHAAADDQISLVKNAVEGQITSRLNAGE
jgi:hypothetical protein